MSRARGGHGRGQRAREQARDRGGTARDERTPARRERAEQPGVLSLAGGLPTPETFPIEAMREATAKVLKELVGHHVDEEERNIWAQVKENFTDEQREQMNRDFLAAKKNVKV